MTKREFINEFKNPETKKKLEEILINYSDDEEYERIDFNATLQYFIDSIA